MTGKSKELSPNHFCFSWRNSISWRNSDGNCKFDNFVRCQYQSWLPSVGNKAASKRWDRGEEGWPDGKKKGGSGGLKGIAAHAIYGRSLHFHKNWDGRMPILGTNGHKFLTEAFIMRLAILLRIEIHVSSFLLYMPCTSATKSDGTWGKGGGGASHGVMHCDGSEKCDQEDKGLLLFPLNCRGTTKLCLLKLRTKAHKTELTSSRELCVADFIDNADWKKSFLFICLKP